MKLNIILFSLDSSNVKLKNNKNIKLVVAVINAKLEYH